MTDQTQTRADVIPLRPEGRVRDDVVQDAEIVADEPRQTYNTRTIPPVSIPHVREAMARGTEVAVRASVPAAKTTGSAIARHTLYIAAGVAVIRHRRKDAKTTDPYVRAMHAAEECGDLEAVERWADRIERAKQSRHQRRMDWVKSPKEVAKALLIATSTVPLVLLTIGVAIAVNTGDVSALVDPFKAVADAVMFAIWFATAYGVLLAGGGTAGLLWYLDRLGKRHGNVKAPQWLDARPTGTESTSVAVDEGMIMTALRNLGLPVLNKAFKEGWGTSTMPTWVQPPLPLGPGWEFALRLPQGVPASHIRARKEILAHNFGRKPEEVWVELDEDDSMAMRCYVLDPGALRQPVPAYPLIDEGTTNFWSGFPVGIDARRRPVETQVFERNFVAAGIMGSGKSTLIMALLAGAVLDPLVDIDVFCFAENNDFEWLRPLANVNTGDTDENVDACLDHIEALQDSLTERGRLLAKHDEDFVTREIAQKEPALRPRIVVIDECQALFRQDKPEDRRAVVNMLVKFYSAARKYGIVLVFATPTPSDQSLPRDLVSVTTNKACFAIGDKTRNNIVLGDKAHENGLSALGLKPSVKRDGVIVELNDTGTSVSVGFMPEDGILRAHHIPSADRRRIVERGLELRNGKAPATVTAAESERRDLLADVAEVLRGEAKVKTTDVAARLRELAPNWRPYKGLDGAGVKKALTAEGVRVTMSDGYDMVRPERVAEAIAKRSATQE